jgi:hypothetical protein
MNTRNTKFCRLHGVVYVSNITWRDIVSSQMYYLFFVSVMYVGLWCLTNFTCFSL